MRPRSGQSDNVACRCYSEYYHCSEKSPDVHDLPVLLDHLVAIVRAEVECATSSHAVPHPVTSQIPTSVPVLLPPASHTGYVRLSIPYCTQYGTTNKAQVGFVDIACLMRSKKITYLWLTFVCANVLKYQRVQHALVSCNHYFLLIVHVCTGGPINWTFWHLLAVLWLPPRSLLATTGQI